MGGSALSSGNMSNTRKKHYAMRIAEFEKKILAEGLDPREVKLYKGQVMWFFCKSPSTGHLVAYNKEGHCFICDCDIFYTCYNVEVHVEDEDEEYIVVNDHRLYRSSANDLKWDKE